MQASNTKINQVAQFKSSSAGVKLPEDSNRNRLQPLQARNDIEKMSRQLRRLQDKPLSWNYELSDPAEVPTSLYVKYCVHLFKPFSSQQEKTMK